MSTDSQITPEMANIITMGASLSEKPILSILIETVQWLGGPADLIEEIAGRREYKHCGYIQLEFGDYRLNVTLSITNKDHKTTIDVPNDQYAQELYTHYNMLKMTAKSYWKYWANLNEDLVRKIEETLELSLSELQIDPANPTTMYFVQDVPRRVGLFCYYVDSAGNALLKS
jgi:hypothetical protein